MIRFMKVLFVSLLMIIASTAEIRVSAASVLYVSTSGNDNNDCLSPVTACATIDGALTKAAPGDTIRVTAETYTGTAEPVVLVNKDISLSGGWNGAFTSQIGHTVLDGQNTHYVIEIAETTTVSIEYFIIQNGFSDTSVAGMANYGTLTLDNSIVQNNQGTDFGGGGISNYGTLTVQWSTIRDNSGPGVYNWDYAGPLIILNSTINNNSNGVGIRVYNQDASIINSTISGNTNTSYYYDGGGIYYGGGSGKTLLLRNVTITGNRATSSGGGIFMFDTYGGQVLMENSILSGNIANVGSDCSGPIISQGYNIIGDTFNCSFSSTTGDQLNVDPKLGLLQDNGGPTFTHWIYADSTAIDGGNPAGCVDHLGNPLTTDQRGFTRPMDGDSDGSIVCDVGAYEADPNNLPPPSPGSLWYVTKSGNDTNDCNYPATSCYTINGAIGKATSGDTVYISTGIYTATVGVEVVLIDKNITLSGGWNPEFTAQIGNSTIDGQNTRRGITISDELSAWIERLDVRYGLSLGGDGGGIYMGYLSKLTLDDVIIYANIAGSTEPYQPSYNGGGIGMGTFGRLTLNNSLIMGNLASSSGGGIYCGESTITLNDSIITNNTAGLGGGIASKNGGQIELNHSEVTNNVSLNWGGGIDSSNTDLILKNSSISGNIAGGAGGGVYGHQMTIENSTIRGNQGGAGGGIYTAYNIEIRNSTILGNSANGNAGGIYSSGSLILINTTIAYNTANAFYGDEADGGGIFRAGGYTLQASNVTIAGNVAERNGGGIWSQGASITLRNTLLAENHAATGPDCTGTIQTDGYNLVGDTSGCTFVPTTGDLTNIDPRLALQYGWPATLALWVDSPAIDGGNPGGCTDHLDNPILVDQIGTIRPLDGDGDGSSICDIGAYEYDPAHPPHWFFLPVIAR